MYLSENLIETIDKQAFKGLQSLKILDIFGVGLDHEIEPGTFDPISKTLLYLNLLIDKVSNFVDDTFKNLSNLKYLNGFKKFQSGLF